MTIERNEPIRFHEQGTLDAVTRWIASHADGISEWMKNVRRQYQADRANVAPEHRVAVLLLRDASGDTSARIGLLDVGGATVEDVTAWSEWQNPEASSRGSKLDEEQTQGNGGKTYMYRMFVGPARILGVRESRRNCKGFEGDASTVQRGTPGWIPTLSSGRDVEISSFAAELSAALKPYNISFDELPESVRVALRARQAFTLVEGEEPTELYKGRIDVDDLVARIVRHEQSTLCLEQVDIFVVHNGRPQNGGQPLRLPPIAPYSGFESPLVCDIPAELPLDSGENVSTTAEGTREAGRLILHTSAENMPAAWKNLRHRWRVVYRTRHQMVGAKGVGDIVGTMAGAQFIYGSVELPALEPAYVEHGRRRPKPGPLIEALDRFIAEKIKEIAHKITARREERLDERSLDQVHEENRQLDAFKNQFLPNAGEGDGGHGGNGTGPIPPPPPPPPPVEWGDTPDELDYQLPAEGITVGAGVSVLLKALLGVRVRDEKGRPVSVTLEWHTSDRLVATVTPGGELAGKAKGTCEIWVAVKGTKLVSERIPVAVWNVDHVLLTPRAIDLPLGTRQRIVAEVTDDEGRRSTSVLLEWRHDADDQLTVRISREGIITGNRIGRTAVVAGAGSVFARIPAEVNVLPNPDKLKSGGGFPRLLLTERDLDPATGSIRHGDPDEPALWQEPTDYVHNVWWLNVQSPEAAFAFKQRTTDPLLWRTYHAEKVIDMVVEVWMSEEFTRKGEGQRPDFWSGYQAALVRHRVRLVQLMWKRIEPYVTRGEKLPRLAGGEAEAN